MKPTASHNRIYFLTKNGLEENPLHYLLAHLQGTWSLMGQIRAIGRLWFQEKLCTNPARLKCILVIVLCNPVIFTYKENFSCNRARPRPRFTCCNKLPTPSVTECFSLCSDTAQAKREQRWWPMVTALTSNDWNTTKTRGKLLQIQSSRIG